MKSTLFSLATFAIAASFSTGCTSSGSGSAFNLNSNTNNSSSFAVPSPSSSPTATPSPSPGASPTATPAVTSIGVGGGHVCAVYNGGILCWGDNTEGSLGNNSQTSSNVPAQVSGIGPGSGATYVPRLGTYFSCAIVGGGVKCWGENASGANGNGGSGTTSFPCAGTGNVTFTNGATANTVPVSVFGMGAGSGVTALATGEISSACAIQGGAVKCWGANLYGGLGNGTFTCHNTPQTVSGLSTGATAIGVGSYFACAVSGGLVKCWGDNTYGQLGTTTGFCSTVGANCSTTPVTVPGLSNITQVVAGDDHACALRNDGAVFCWGENTDGQLGNNSTTNSTSPVAASGFGAGSGVVSITAGFFGTCAVKSDGSTYCWGVGNYGQIGNGGTSNALVPTAVSTLGAGSGTTAVSTDFANGCSVTAGHAYCWGTNFYGNLGTGTTANSYVPVRVLGL